MVNTYFISDLHFGHSKIIEYERRPFKDIEEMDWTIVGNWNNTVKKNDKIFILGDFSFYQKEQTANIIKALHGYKILVLGNHDRGITWWKDTGMDEVIKYPIIFKNYFILSHQPVYLNANMPYVNIHGHTHSNKMESKQYVNVSMECNNYTPVLFEDIKSRLM